MSFFGSPHKSAGKEFNSPRTSTFGGGSGVAKSPSSIDLTGYNDKIYFRNSQTIGIGCRPVPSI